MFPAARRPRRMRKVIAFSASFSFSLLLISSSIVLDEDRPPQRDRCASAAAPPLLRLAAPLSPHARLARPFLGCLSTPRLVSSCVCVWPAAAWPLGGLPSAVCGRSNATMINSPARVVQELPKQEKCSRLPGRPVRPHRTRTKATKHVLKRGDRSPFRIILYARRGRRAPVFGWLRHFR